MITGAIDQDDPIFSDISHTERADCNAYRYPFVLGRTLSDPRGRFGIADKGLLAVTHDDNPVQKNRLFGNFERPLLFLFFRDNL